MTGFALRIGSLLTAALVVAACGGSDGSPALDAAERINGVAVPPAPDPTANAATLAGVDSDGNGVRDDIDRLLAATFGSDAERHAQAVRVNRSLQTALVNPSSATVEAHVREVSCIRDRDLLQASSQVTRATLDTPDRTRTYASTFAGAGASREHCS